MASLPHLSLIPDIHKKIEAEQLSEVIDVICAEKGVEQNNIQ